ncbi:MAG: hypothetical protein ACI9MB_004025, partial [Verrucomicrobiales bacterium]
MPVLGSGIVALVFGSKASPWLLASGEAGDFVRERAFDGDGWCAVV